MDPLPNEWLPLLLMVFALGLKHGMDPDHLVTIDGLARFNSARPRLSRWAGVLFSLGHGLVVTLVAGLVAWAATEWQVPYWVEDFGTWVSIVFLLLLGTVNVAAVFRAAPNEVVQLIGVKSHWFGRLTQISHPVLIATVGALFALSFDTLSQAALFSLAASSMTGWQFAAVLGVVFMIGMMATDGINGLWVSRLIRRADRTALVASRVLSLVIAGLSFMVALLGIAKHFSPAVAARTEGRELLIGVIVVSVLAISFYWSMRRVRPVSSQG
jgi:nickel/cobalt transporter (NiCoT) family protein